MGTKLLGTGRSSGVLGNALGRTRADRGRAGFGRDEVDEELHADDAGLEVDRLVLAAVQDDRIHFTSLADRNSLEDGGGFVAHAPLALPRGRNALNDHAGAGFEADSQLVIVRVDEADGMFVQSADADRLVETGLTIGDRFSTVVAHTKVPFLVPATEM